jgi:hypothetical protein
LVANGNTGGQLVYLNADILVSGISKNKGFYYWDATAATPAWTAIDGSNDAFINDTSNNMVKLGTKSIGSSREFNTDFVVTDNARVGIGTAIPSSGLHLLNDVTGTLAAGFVANANRAGILQERYSNDATSVQQVYQRARGSVATPAALQNNDNISANFSRAYTTLGSLGTAPGFVDTAGISVKYVGNGTTNKSKMYLDNGVARTGATNGAKSSVMLLDENGNVAIGTNPSNGNIKQAQGDAVLDLNGHNPFPVINGKKGFLPPRHDIASDSEDINAAVLGNSEGLIIYNNGSNGMDRGIYWWDPTGSAGTGTNGGVSDGMGGGAWIRFN